MVGVVVRILRQSRGVGVEGGGGGGGGGGGRRSTPDKRFECFHELLVRGGRGGGGAQLVCVQIYSCHYEDELKTGGEIKPFLSKRAEKEF